MLRAWAAIAVIATHYLNHFLPPDSSLLITTLKNSGRYGVDIFFVISGYVITRNYYFSNGGPIKFLAKRALKIYSGYWLVLAAVLALKLITHVDISQYNLWKSVLLLPQQGRANPLGGLVWTLSHELIFYILFALLLLFPVNFRPKIAAVYAVTLALFFIALRCDNLYPDLIATTNWLISPFIFEFMAGAVVYFIKPPPRQLFLWLGLVGLGAVGLISAYWFDGNLGNIIEKRSLLWRVALLTPPAVLLVCWAVGPNATSRSQIAKMFVVIGNASYMLYLAHMPIIAFAPSNILAFTLPLVAIAVALLLHHWLEKPIYKFLCAKLQFVR